MYKVPFDPVARLFSAHRTQSAAEMLIASFMAVQGVKFNHSNSLLAMGDVSHGSDLLLNNDREFFGSQYNTKTDLTTKEALHNNFKQSNGKI